MYIVHIFMRNYFKMSYILVFINGRCIDNIYFDCVKAFDTVSHIKLLSKLNVLN